MSQNSTLELNQAVEAIYETAFDPLRWRQTLFDITKCFDAEGTLLFFQNADGSCSAVNSPGILDEVNARFISEGWSHRDVRAMRAQEQGTFGRKAVVADHDVMTPEEIETHPYYTQFLGPHGLAWFMAASVSPNPDMFVVLSVQRAKRKPIFSEHDQALLEMLSHHAERSLRLSMRMMQLELSNTALGEAVEHIGCGVVLVNEIGQAVFCNAAGRAALAAPPQNTSVARPAANLTLHRSLNEQIASLLSMPFGGQAVVCKPILLRGDGETLASVAYVLPVATRNQHSLSGLAANVSVIVLVLQQDPMAPVDPTVVRDILGLTLGEARVASLVAAGRSPRETAVALDITEETARTVLKRVFAKTNISKQSHLATLLTRLTLRGAPP